MPGSSGKSDASVGLAKASIYGAYRMDPAKRLVDDVDVRVMVVKGNGCTAVLAVADVCNLWESTCLRLREKVAAAVGVPVEHVGITATQNHAAEFVLGDDQKFDFDKLDKAFVNAAREAASKAKPVQVARVARHAPGLAIRGRLPVKGFDNFVVYYGYRVNGERADGSHVVKRAITNLSNGDPFPVRAFQVAGTGDADFDTPEAPVPVPTPLYAPPANDDLVQGLFFRTPEGQPVGSIIRFAVHPICANRQKMDWQSGELCAYARRRLEAKFGGTSIYLTGPSSDQYPLVARKSIELATEFGDKLADVALAGLPGATWQPLSGDAVAAGSREIYLPRRADFHATVASAKKEQDDIEARFKGLVAKGTPLPELKKIGDHYENLWLVTGGQLYEWSDSRATQPKPDCTQHILFAMRIGPSVIAAWSGDSSGIWSCRLRRETLDDDLIVMERTSWGIYGENPNYPPAATGEGDAASFEESDSDRVLADTTRGLIEDLMSGRTGP